MRRIIVSITEQADTAKAIDSYIRSTMNDHIDSYYMTYCGELLSGALIRQADLFVIELFATDSVGPYTEGLHAAVKWISLGKRALIVSGSAIAEKIESPLYWDLASRDTLKSRMISVLESPTPSPSALDTVKKHFHRYYRKAEDPHRELKTVGIDK